MKTLLPLLASTALVAGCSVFGAAAAEEPPYEVLKQEENIQVRQYGEVLVAQTVVEGEYDDVSGKAFRRLAGFIFGDNQSQEKVAMTAPVLQQPATSEKIAMTAPVLQEPAGESWIMTFVMPAEYTLETLPRPNDPAVTIRSIAAKRVATIRFSGLMNKRKLDRYSTELLRWIGDNGYSAVSPPRSAGYNPPWTLPPLRRNEIHFDIE